MSLGGSSPKFGGSLAGNSAVEMQYFPSLVLFKITDKHNNFGIFSLTASPENVNPQKHAGVYFMDAKKNLGLSFRTGSLTQWPENVTTSNAHLQSSTHCTIDIHVCQSLKLQWQAKIFLHV